MKAVRPALRAVPKSGEPPQEGVPLLADATHDQLARFYGIELELDCGVAPIGAEGRLWRPDSRGLWVPTSVEQLAVALGRRFVHFKTCRKSSDYGGIARHLVALTDAPDFFERSAVGVVCPGGFWTIDVLDGKVKRAELTADARQRFAIEIDPDFDTVPELFLAYLAMTFAGDGRDAQIDLAAEAVGAALFGLAGKLMTAFLILGPGASGKSTFLALIERLFPRNFVSAVSPVRWAHEYFIAGLAGKRVNLVAELPDDHPLPAAPFKNVIGCDLIEARHPTHRPFYFRNCAAHFFSSNSLPATLDRGDAFFRRWRVLHFANTVAPDARDPDLPPKIIERELGAVLAWAMRGAERVAQRGRYGTSPAHDSILQRWRVGSNPVLLFLTDPDYCELATGHRERSADVYEKYRGWAQTHGNRPMSSQSFWDLADKTAGAIGVIRGRDTGRYCDGVRLVQCGERLFQ